MQIGFTEEKKKAFIEFDFDELRNFVKGLPQSDLAFILKKFPKVNGFRPGKDADQKLSNFIRRISRWNGTDWNIMCEIWILWTLNNSEFQRFLNFKTRKDLEIELLKFQENNDVLKDVVKKLVQVFNLASLSLNILRDWFDFSPYSPSEDIQQLLLERPSQADIYLRSRLTDLEKSIKNIENNLYETKSETKSLLENLSHIEKISLDLNELQNETVYFKKNNQETSNQLKVLESRLDKISLSAETKFEEHTDLIKQLSNNVESYSLSLGEKLTTLRELNEEYQDKILNFEETLNKNQKENDYINETLKNVEQQIASAISSYSVVSENSTSTSNQNSNTVHIQTKSLLVDNRHECVYLETLGETIAHLERNLNKLGVKLQSARNIAIDVISAVTSGQLITFTGSLGLEVAERCAISLAGNSLIYCRIPSGLINSNHFDSVLDDWLYKSRERPVAIIFEGMNRSALEVYGLSLQRLIRERILQISDATQSLFLFATIVEGPSTLPISKEIVELGPVLNTDSLGWMDKFAIKGVPGLISEEVIESISSLDNKDQVDIEEMNLPEWIFSSSGVLWRKTVITSALFCNEVYTILGVPTKKDHIVFGWIIPMVALLKRERISEFIDSIEEVDDRSKALISLLVSEVGPL
ncbi:hypothetical protein M5X11_09180 [Paenibacillus alginolyticus]|uniref:hypothetical protein n=1 Tax=Paenibacillus alginolyticus TaxID=59839 RepID=UPI0004063D7D|nr:hypothetical protein [Paenibacillus alginolyticus]MCY9665130.1 hypothetical protein [Paenibacillus alginolyticus]